jgi:tRNA nucleotidyltransferase (CCA-adding enzyme)
MKVPSVVKDLCSILRGAGHQAYVVGGSVRDMFLGRNPSDWDVTSSAKPDEVIALFDKVIPTGLQHGTVTVMLNGEAIEVTTFRGEGAYTDGRHPDSVEFVQDLNEDLKRRDFTINAMAFDPISEEVKDPFSGQKDLKAKVVRTVGSPMDRFTEDGLRPMRAIRFASVLGFDIENETFSAITKTIDRFKMVSVERVCAELVKMLNGVKPSRGMEMLRESGLLAEILPEMLPMVGLVQNKHHRLDVWDHTLEVLDAIPARGVLRLAALLHDIGKPTTAKPREDNPAENCFHGHGKVGAEMADEISRRLKFSNADREKVCHLVKNHLFAMGNEEPTKASLRRFVRKIGVENLDDLFALRFADVSGHANGEARKAEVEDFRKRVDEIVAEFSLFSVKDMDINGDVLMKHFGRSGGQWLGKLLNSLFEKVTDDPSLNDQEKLLGLAEEIID